MMLSKLVKPWLKILYFVFKFCVCWYDLISSKNKLFHFVRSWILFPVLEILIEIVSMFKYKLVSHSGKNIFFVIYVIFPNLESKIYIVVMSWAHSSKNSKLIIRLIHSSHCSNLLFKIFSLGALNSKLSGSSLKSFIKFVNLKSVKASPNEMVISFIWNLINHSFSSIKKIVLSNLFTFHNPHFMLFNNSILDLSIDFKFPSMKNFLFHSKWKHHCLQSSDSSYFIFFSNCINPLCHCLRLNSFLQIVLQFLNVELCNFLFKNFIFPLTYCSSCV